MSNKGVLLWLLINKIQSSIKACMIQGCGTRNIWRDVLRRLGRFTFFIVFSVRLKSSFNRPVINTFHDKDDLSYS